MQPAITVKNLSKTFRLPGERRGTLRGALALGRDRRDGVADVADPLVGEGRPVAREVLEDREVLAGDHGVHSRHRQRRDRRRAGIHLNRASRKTQYLLLV